MLKELAANLRLVFSARWTRNNFPLLYLGLAAIACLYALLKDIPKWILLKLKKQINSPTLKTLRSCYFRLNLNIIFDVLFPANFFLFDNFSLGQFCVQKYHLLTVCYCFLRKKWALMCFILFQLKKCLMMQTKSTWKYLYLWYSWSTPFPWAMSTPDLISNSFKSRSLSVDTKLQRGVKRRMAWNFSI